MWLRVRGINFKYLKKIIKYLLFFLLISTTFSFVEQSTYAIIKFKNLEFLKKGWGGNKFYFTVNGNTFSPDTNAHQIIINEISFDNFSFYSPAFKDTFHFMAKFQRGKTYIIAINTCSQYELYPEKGAKKGIARFDKLLTNDTLTGVLDVSQEKLTQLKASNYLSPQMSAMCFYASSDIILANKDYESSYEGEKKIILKTRYHFLHGEKLLINVSSDKKKFDIKIEGYLKKGENIRDYVPE